MSSIISKINDWTENNREDCIGFLQRIIAIPSPSGQEKELGHFLKDKMRQFGFDTSKVDALYNAMGTIKGSGKGRSLLLNGHIDHVPVGDMIDPYSGRLMKGEAFGTKGEVIYGRAASDMKGAVAAMIMAGKMINDLGIKLEGDYKVAAVSQEEIGGAGTMSTIVDSRFLGDVVLIGEATNMDLALGHRGSMKTSVVIMGRACHASAPERGINALYKAISLINKIREELVPRLPDHPIYGKASLVVTQIEVSPKATNVVPEECIFHIDCRNNPNFSAETLYGELKELIKELKAEDSEFEAIVLPSSLINEKRFSGFYTDPKEFHVVNEAIEAIREIYQKPEKKVWTFATDGRIYSRLGIPVIGFGPGEEKFAHTEQDHVKVEDYINTIKVYAWLACKICGLREN
jgi:putative selenium metabolism hydrolase